MSDEIISVTGALSQIFRYSIKRSDMVTLQEEMDIVRAYRHLYETGGLDPKFHSKSPNTIREDFAAGPFP